MLADVRDLRLVLVAGETPCDSRHLQQHRLGISGISIDGSIQYPSLGESEADVLQLYKAISFGVV